jgi:hypothetical protein
MDYRIEKCYNVTQGFSFKGWNPVARSDIDYGSFDKGDTILLLSTVTRIDGGESMSCYYYCVDGDRIVEHMDKAFKKYLVPPYAEEFEPSETEVDKIVDSFNKLHELKE